MPPFEEQRCIVAKIEELLLYIEKYDKAHSELKALNKKFSVDIQKSIIQYTMQGRLVEQNPEEGTGEELYCQIQAVKKRLIQTGAIKKEKPLDVPISWKRVRLAEICEQKPTNGYFPQNVDYETDVKKLTLTTATAGYFKSDAFKYADVGKDNTIL